MSEQITLQKPILRGYFHQESFFFFLGAGCLLMAKASTNTALFAAGIYVLGLLLLFGTSAIYHRPHWQPARRKLLKRFDHSAIFVVIAGTFTPICLLALSKQTGNQLLFIIWIAAFIGVMQSIFWVKAPKYITAIFYIIMGWLAVPYFAEFKAALGLTQFYLIVCGGIVYTVGAIFYALKKPKLNPAYFGYHELFHIFTIIGASLHFVVIYRLIV